MTALSGSELTLSVQSSRQWPVVEHVEADGLYARCAGLPASRGPRRPRAQGREHEKKEAPLWQG